MANSESFADATSDMILKACYSVDAASKLTSCVRNGTGRTVARIVSSGQHDASELASQLQAVMPLACVTTEENVLTGRVEAKIVIPTSEDEWAISQARAKSSVMFVALSRAFWVALVAGFSAWLAIASQNLSVDQA